jgi:SAM-dependent methyltransferase
MHAINRILDCIEKGDLPTDELLDSLLPKELRIHADQHFAGVYAIQLASEFLVKNQTSPHILDIGSGTGKFSLLGALLHKTAQFTGVEYRPSFVQIAKDIAVQFDTPNVHFQCQNILFHSFENYNGFFMFNPFLEHRNTMARMNDFDDEPNQATDYVAHVHKELAHRPAGTRLVCLYVNEEQIPKNFKIVDQKMGETMRFYISQ